MPNKNLTKIMYRDGTNHIVEQQFYDNTIEDFVLVSKETPYPSASFPKHHGFHSSQGEGGWYALLEDNEVITFETPLNSIIIEAKDTALKIKINDFTDYLYVDANSYANIEDLEISSIQVMNVTGVTIRWRGLSL